MDFGLVGVEGLVVGTSSSSAAAAAAASFLDPELKQRLCVSGIFKTDRSSASDDEFRSSKLVKNDDFPVSMAMQSCTVVPSMIRYNNHSSNSLFSAAARQEQQQMLCFSSQKTESTLPYFNYPASASAPCSNYSGFNLGSLRSANQQGGVSCKGGGFTPSQWMELEQQALIYKYINANIPVPSNLLSPIKKAFESAGFSFHHGGSFLRPNNNSLGWGGFQLGYLGSSDPEPGRCRRTDGKKWRCSKDAMPDQKYCERHMNRGRHRSRKPVEGQSAHPLSGATNTIAKKGSTTLLPPVASSASAAAGSGLSTAVIYNTSAAYQIHPGGLSLSSDNNLDRFFMSKDNLTEKPQNSTATFSNNMKSTDNPFLMMKYDNESSRDRFGSDSSITLFGNLGTLKELTDTETCPHHPNHHRFMNSDWDPPETQVSNIQSGSTHLSISMMSSSDQEKLAILPLNLGMGSFGEDPKFHTNWVPISVGGPLGEVLQNANSSSSSSTECKNSSGLNLMMDGWERSSPAGSYSSPTAVLQKSSFESVSNSSAGSSPRAA